MKTTIGTFLSTLFVLVSAVESFAPTTTKPATAVSSSSSSVVVELSAVVSRRDTFEVASALWTVVAATTTTAAAAAAPLVARAAEEEDESTSEFIQKLKARSETNKEANRNYAMRADKLSFRDFKDAKLRKPSFVNVKSPSSGEVKLLTKEEFATLDNDGKITTEYGTRMK